MRSREEVDHLAASARSCGARRPRARAGRSSRRRRRCAARGRRSRRTARPPASPGRPACGKSRRVVPAYAARRAARCARAARRSTARSCPRGRRADDLAGGLLDRRVDAGPVVRESSSWPWVQHCERAVGVVRVGADEVEAAARLAGVADRDQPSLAPSGWRLGADRPAAARRRCRRRGRAPVDGDRLDVQLDGVEGHGGQPSRRAIRVSVAVPGQAAPARSRSQSRRTWSRRAGRSAT